MFTPLFTPRGVGGKHLYNFLGFFAPKSPKRDLLPNLPHAPYNRHKQRELPQYQRQFPSSFVTPAESWGKWELRVLVGGVEGRGSARGKHLCDFSFFFGARGWVREGCYGLPGDCAVGVLGEGAAGVAGEAVSAGSVGVLGEGAVGWPSSAARGSALPSGQSGREV